MFIEKRHRRTDLAWRTKAALESVVLQKSGLHGVQRTVSARKSFDGDDIVVRMHHRESQAGIDAAAVHQYRACTALPAVTAFLGALEPQVFPQGIQQRDSRFQLQFMNGLIHLQRHRCGNRRCHRRVRIARRTLRMRCRAICVYGHRQGRGACRSGCCRLQNKVTRRIGAAVQGRMCARNLRAGAPAGRQCQYLAVQQSRSSARATRAHIRRDGAASS